jgi:hypothetical protein
VWVLGSNLRLAGYRVGVSGRVRMGIYIYIYYLIKYCRAGGYPPDQNSKNRYPSVIRIFKISVSVSVRMYASGRTDGRAGRPDWSGGSGFAVFCPPLDMIEIDGHSKRKRKKRK